MLEDLMEVINTLKKRIQTHGAVLKVRETRTRMALIDPLLKVLGWDTSDPALVIPEFYFKSQKRGFKNQKRADYALLDGANNPVFVLEAKKLYDPLDNHTGQMAGYAFNDGIPYAGLTDGNYWRMYDVFKPKPLEERLVLDISIVETPLHESALQLLLLWRQNLASRNPQSARRPSREYGPPPAKKLDTTVGNKILQERTYTFENHLEGKPPSIQTLMHSIREYVVGLDPAFEEVPRKDYVAYKISKNIVCMEPHKKSIKLFLQLTSSDIKLPPPGYRDVTSIGHYGTGNAEFTVEAQEDLDAIKSFIELAYNKVEGQSF